MMEVFKAKLEGNGRECEVIFMMPANTPPAMRREVFLKACWAALEEGLWGPMPGIPEEMLQLCQPPPATF